MTHTAETVKQWLSQYREWVLEIKCLEGRRDFLLQRLNRLQSSRLHSDDFTLDVIKEQLDEIEEIIKQNTKKAAPLRSEIIEVSQQLKGDSFYCRKAIVMHRYIDCMDWNDVNFTIYGTMDDFTERAGSYLRNCHNHHIAVIEQIAEILNNNENGGTQQ